LDDARSEYDCKAEKMEREKSELDSSLLDNLSAGFPKLFRSDKVSSKDKKRMVRYLIEDVTLTQLAGNKAVLLQIRYKGHTTQSVAISTALHSYEKWTTAPEVISTIDKAAENCTEDEIATLLTKQGFKSGKGLPFSTKIVKKLMYSYSIPSMKERYIKRGYVTCACKAKVLGISPSGLMHRINTGSYHDEHVRVSLRNEYVFPPAPDSNAGV
jgi:hypothetical protein